MDCHVALRLLAMTMGSVWVALRPLSPAPIYPLVIASGVKQSVG